MSEPSFYRIVSIINHWAGRFSAVMLIILIVSLVYEVVSRYFFNAPTIWASEMAQYLFGISFLAGGGYTLMQKGHVRVDILLTVISKPKQWVLAIICYSLSFFYLSVLLYISLERTWDSLRYMEQMDSMWKPYTFPVLIFVPIGVTLIMLQILAMIQRTWLKLRSKNQQGDRK